MESSHSRIDQHKHAQPADVSFTLVKRNSAIRPNYLLFISLRCSALNLYIVNFKCASLETQQDLRQVFNEYPRFI